MARELVPHDAASVDELLQLIDEVVQTRQLRVFRDLVTVSPTRAASAGRRRARRRRGRTSADDPIWNLMGLVDTGGPGDVARDVDRYLADA